MKMLLVLALVLLLLLIGLPLTIGMADMGPCPACAAPDAPLAAMCLAILALGALFMTLACLRRISQGNDATPLFLALSRLDRPPQHA